MTELHELSLEELAARIRAREVSSDDAVRASLARIDGSDGALRGFITVTPDAALAEARALDRGADRDGPLRGVPVALKDLFDTAGVRTTAGSKIFAERVPTEDARVVTRLREAGAIVVGKTNLHEWAFGVTSQNPHFGACRNPWDVSRIPGGSSGGSAAALAAGMCFGALGSDTGGSIRIPSSLCGTVGLKPTYGRVSLSGVVPLAWSLDHAGPMTRTVRDCAIIYGAIAGYDPQDPASAERDVEDPLDTIEDGVRGLRLGLPRQHFFDGVEPDVTRLVRDAARALEGEGATIEEIDLSRSGELLATQAAIIGTEGAAFHRERLRSRPADLGEDVLRRLRMGERVTGIDYAQARRRRDEIRHAFIGALRGYDALLMPTTPGPAPLAGSEDPLAMAARLTAGTSPFNLTGLPAISLPCGLAGGLPVGLQIASGPWREATVLRVARAYERVSPSIGSPASVEPRTST